MFAMPSTSFDLPAYASEFAHLLVEAQSPPPIHTRRCNKLVLDYLDIGAEEGKDSDRHDTFNCSPCLVCFGPPSYMYYFFKMIYKFIC